MCHAAEAAAQVDKHTLLLSVIHKAVLSFSFSGEEQLCEWTYNVKEWRETQESVSAAEAPDDSLCSHNCWKSCYCGLNAAAPEIIYNS